MCRENRKGKQKKSIEKALLFGYDRKQCKKAAPELVEGQRKSTEAQMRL